MELSPRYGADPVIVLDGDPAAVVHPTIRQRRRLATALAAFSDEEWEHPSRCDGWSNRDVIIHLHSTNTFWVYSIHHGAKGEPTQLLASFDPVNSPAELVAGSQHLATRDVLDQFVASTEALVDALESIGDDLLARAESPPGHVSISAVTHHALWDSWVHERDVLLPLGITPDEEPDEIAHSLRYVAALAAALSVAGGFSEGGTLGVTATDPDVAFTVEAANTVAVRAGDDVSDPRLTGGAVDLIEWLSTRVPRERPFPDGAAWILKGISAVLDPQSA